MLHATAQGRSCGLRTSAEETPNSGGGTALPGVNVAEIQAGIMAALMSIAGDNAGADTPFLEVTHRLSCFLWLDAAVGIP